MIGVSRRLGNNLSFLFSVFLIGNLNAQVGIGTTTPAESSLLDIKNDDADKGILIPRVDITDLENQAPITGTIVESLLVYNTNVTTGKGFYYWDATDTEWKKLLAGADGSDNIYTTDGSLVGERRVTQNEFPLELFGNVGENALTLRRTNNADSLGIAFRNSGGFYDASIFLNSGTSGQLVFATQTNTADVSNLGLTMALDDNGNIGINTDAPDSKLTVIGGINGRGLGISVADSDLDNSNKTGYIKTLAYDTDNPPMLGLAMFGTQTSNNLQFGANSPTHSAPTTITFNTDNDNNLTTPGGIGRMIINQSGNVGIGTNAPTAKLEIDNTSGLKFTRLTASSPFSTGRTLGVDATGNVVTVAGFTTPVTFVASLGNGSGGANNATIAANGFNTINLPSVNTNIGGGVWNPANNTFSVPVTGVYIVKSSLRLRDGSPSRNVFQAVGTTNTDIPDGIWQTNTGTRWTMLYTRIARFNQGDLLRLYMFSDGPVANLSDASLNISLISLN
jgi:hypothetical protein